MKRGPGRRPGGADTRAEVVEAARGEFAARGYDGASIRGIARLARVDPALVHHYFASKQELFVAALKLPFNPAEELPRLLAGDPAQLGERIARFALTMWESPAGRPVALAMVRSAAANDRAAAMLRGFLGREVVKRLAATLDGDDAELRVTFAVSHLVGVFMARHVLRVEPLASADLETVIGKIAPTVQRYLGEG